MAGTYFLGMVLGVPLVIFVLALLAGYLNRDRDAEVLDWKPTRLPSEKPSSRSMRSIRCVPL